jgi:hydrogenase-4 component B
LITPEHAVVVAILICVAGALVALLVAHYRTFAGWISFVFVSTSAGLVGVACRTVLLLQRPSPHPETIWTMPRFGFVLRMHVDGLSAVFLFLAALIAVPAALYSISYMQHYREYSVARYYPNLLLFVAAIYGLLATTDMMWFFLAFWQLMTLPGYALVRFENKERENVRAAYKYLIMMQIACAAALIGVQILVMGAGGDSLKYDVLSVSERVPVMLHTHPLVAALAFAFFLTGFGIKMGMWPFGQLWLPDAHPAAPSPVSAMFSGVMIKTGFYGLIRCFLWLIPASALSLFPLGYWGMLVAVLGTITLFVGTMQALQQGQSKRLLAFSSIGQVGYMLLGLGACMALISAGPAMAPVAALALMGALLHVLHHGVFKGLLFLNAGSMLNATGTQDMNRVSGLIRFMPLTAITALVASFSISGVPLFSGFVSKWTIYVAMLQGSTAAHYLVICAIVAILTSGLTLALFIKFFGASFLSRASTLVTESASMHRLEPGFLMQAPQVFLASLCILFGLLPAIAFRLIGRAFAHNDPQTLAASLGNEVAATSGSLRGVEMFQSGHYMPLALALVMGLTFVAAFAISRLGGAKRRVAVPWFCGYATEADCHRYVANNFYVEVKHYFRWLGGAKPGIERLP